MTNLEKRKLLSALSHGALILNVAVLPLLIPIAVLVLSDDPIVQQNAREALNFVINNCCLYLHFFAAVPYWNWHTAAVSNVFCKLGDANHCHCSRGYSVRSGLSL